MPLREFLYVDDMAAASLHVMNLPQKIYDSQTKPMLSHINVGSGVEINIKDLAQNISEIVGFKGCVEFDQSKPDGTMKKLMDSSRLNHLGWHARVDLKEGLVNSYKDFLENNEVLRK
jgi:GDP-L-fucose synthase